MLIKLIIPVLVTVLITGASYAASNVQKSDFAVKNHTSLSIKKPKKKKGKTKTRRHKKCEAYGG